MKYIPMNELPEEVFKASKVSFFRHQGLYMCKAYILNQEYCFWLTDKETFLTKSQAKKLLQKKFPYAIVEKKIVPRSTPSCR